MLPIDPLDTRHMARGNSESRIKQVAMKFEAMLVESMLKQSTQKLFSERQQGEMSEIYGEMWQKQLAEEIANANAFGIAQQLRISLGKGKTK